MARQTETARSSKNRPSWPVFLCTPHRLRRLAPVRLQSVPLRAVPVLRASLAEPHGQAEELSRAQVRNVDLIRGVPALMRSLRALRERTVGDQGDQLQPLPCGKSAALVAADREHQNKDVRHIAWLQRRMRTQLEQGSEQIQCSRTANTCANLLKLWTFIGPPLVAPTNNAAERALRDYVIKRKLSYCTRSKRRMDFTERIFSTVQTCALQGRQTFGLLEEAIQSWLADKTAPSLVPASLLSGAVLRRH